MVDIHDDLIETGVCTPEQVRETLDRYGALSKEELRSSCCGATVTAIDKLKHEDGSEQLNYICGSCKKDIYAKISSPGKPTVIRPAKEDGLDQIDEAYATSQRYHALTHSYSDLGGYEPYDKSDATAQAVDGNDHDCSDPEQCLDSAFDPSTFDLVAPTGIENLRDDFPDAEPAKGEPDDEATYASYSDAVPASLDEDGELPPYSIYARYWPTPVEKKDRKPLKYVRLVCGHKLKGDGFEPNHRNCERCWFNFFQTHGPLTQAVEEGFQQGGKELIIRLKGKTFFDNWLKFMSTVAFVKSQQEAAKAKENDESIAGPSSGVSLGEDESPAYIGGGSIAD